MSHSSLALSNLRAAVIVIVLFFHSCVAYLASAPQPIPFNQPPFAWQAFPIVDAHRWLGFDVFCATQDVNLMALMFFLSGLFVAPSLARKGAWTYFYDRVRRIGVPFLLAVAFLSPLALYPAYSTRTLDPSLADFWKQWMSLPFWPSGPEWFLWQLMVINVMAAALYAVVPDIIGPFRRFAAWAGTRPLKYFAVLCAGSLIAYAPLAFVYSPWSWTGFGPLVFQYCRPLIYILMFFFGFAIGSEGLGRGLLACDGPLARHWAWWTAAAAGSFCVWAGITALTMPDWATANLAARIGAILSYPIACVAGGLFMLSVFLRFSRRRSWVLDSLSANAYGMYLVHYVFAVWLQYALMSSDLHATVKTMIVFAGVLPLSWAISAGFNRLLAGSSAVATKRPIWTVSR
jgi:hypothetical protein